MAILLLFVFERDYMHPYSEYRMSRRSTVLLLAALIGITLFALVVIIGSYHEHRWIGPELLDDPTLQKPRDGIFEEHLDVG